LAVAEQVPVVVDFLAEAGADHAAVLGGGGGVVGDPLAQALAELGQVEEVQGQLPQKPRLRQEGTDGRHRLQAPGQGQQFPGIGGEDAGDHAL